MVTFWQTESRNRSYEISFVRIMIPEKASQCQFQKRRARVWHSSLYKVSKAATLVLEDVLKSLRH